MLYEVITYRYGMPTLGVIAVGKNMVRDTKFFLLATRVVAELGANIIKTYYCEDFENVVASCPVPIVVAGGKKVPEKEALELAYNAISCRITSYNVCYTKLLRVAELPTNEHTLPLSISFSSWLSISSTTSPIMFPQLMPI